MAMPLMEGAIEADLALRDLTINALAQRLGSDQLVDPFHGARDLTERRLRMVSPMPSRVIRCVFSGSSASPLSSTLRSSPRRRPLPGATRPS